MTNSRNPTIATMTPIMRGIFGALLLPTRKDVRVYNYNYVCIYVYM